MKKTYIIAEAGVNHNGDINLAYKLIDSAVEAKVDAVKFQTWKTETLITKNVEKAEYQKQTTEANESQFDMIKKLELPFDDFRKLKIYCDSKGIEFMSTCVDKESLDFLMSIGLNKIKTSSADLTNYPFLKNIAKYNTDLIISTGMSDLNDIQNSLDVLSKYGQNLDNMTILHCNSEYPTPMNDVNLKAMDTIKSAFNVEIGYSDHTLGIEVPIAAVALGAKVIEKHFTLDRKLPGPDHSASLEPEELKQMVKSIRNIEKALSGNGEKKLSKSESKNVSIVRKSIHLKKGLPKGHVITEEDIIILRPGDGISPMEWNNIVGYKLLKDKSKFDKLSYSDLI